MVVLVTSFREGQVTFFNSALTSLKKGPIRLYHFDFGAILILLILGETPSFLYFFWIFFLRSMAGEAGLEPATFGFGDRCSSQLSYSPTLTPFFPFILLFYYYLTSL